MQRRQPDANFTAPSVAGSLTGNAVDLIVVSTDEALIATIQQAAGSDFTLWHAPSSDAAVDLLVSGHCGILIADLQLLSGDAAATLERLQAQFPELVLLATGRRDEEGRVARSISKGSVYRFLHKPVSPARASLFLSTAARRHHEISSTSSPVLAGARELTRPGKRVPVIVGTVVALLLGVTVFLLRRDPQPATVPSPASAPAPTVADPQPAQPAIDIPAVLAAAQASFKAGNLSDPAGDNALERYRSVLRAEPDNAMALAGTQDILDALETRVTQALQMRDAPRAVRALKALERAQPDHPQLQVLNAQLLTLSRSSRPPNSGGTSKAAASAPPTNVAAARPAPNTQLVRARIAAGQLIEPENDSALFYLRKARDLVEDESANRILATDLGGRLLAQSREALAARDVPLAQARFDEAIALDREFELALPDLADVASELDGVNAAAARSTLDAQLTPVIRLRESGQLLEPAGNNAFERLRALALQFPEAPAIRTEQQRLAFTLVDHGRTALVQGDLDRAGLMASRAEEIVPRLSSAGTLRDQVAAAKEEREAAARVVQARELPRTREVPASYPSDAERRGVEGWVDVEFTIGSTGATRELVVRESQPAGVFDKAALDALAKWRFEPVIRNGRTVDQRAILRVRFTLK